MAQELYVLKCFSCETFQSHIVKKSNKWECKICGAKQSVKKVYGRGSGKDCRVHTQKLNALRGQKEEAECPDRHIKKTSEIVPPEQICSENDSRTSQYTNSFGKKNSKWAEFIDENKADENHRDFTILNKFSHTATSISKGKKRKIDNFPGDHVEESFENRKNMTNFIPNIEKNNQYKIKSTYSNFSEPADSVSNFNFETYYVHEQVSENLEYNNEVNSFNIPQNTVNATRLCSKSSFKWAEYLDEVEEFSYPGTSSNKKPTKPQSKNKNDKNTEVQKNATVSLKWAKYLNDNEDLCYSGISSTITSGNHQDEDGLSINSSKNKDDKVQDNGAAKFKTSGCFGTKTVTDYQSEDNFIRNRVKYDHGEVQGKRKIGYPRVAMLNYRGTSDDDSHPMSSADLRSYNDELGQVISSPSEETNFDTAVPKTESEKSCSKDFNSLSSVNNSISRWKASYCSNPKVNTSLFDADNFKSNNVLKDIPSKTNLNKEISKSFINSKSCEENLHPQSSSLPLFEQSCELSDSEFQLNF